MTRQDGGRQFKPQHMRELAESAAHISKTERASSDAEFESVQIKKLEFFERQDGYRGLMDAYNLSFAQDPKTMDMSLVYTALRDGQIDVGIGNGTDGLIEALHLTVLEDDKHFFPPYDAAPVVREEILERHPAVRQALDDLGGILSEKEMRRWNHEVDGNHRPVEQVAAQLRREKGLD